MEHYVTLFNSAYMPQGLALYKSMRMHCGNFTLWILCMNLEAYDFLKKINLKNVRLISFKDFETSEMAELKKIRTISEYCWTVTPFAPHFVLNSDPSIERVTYVDADTYFLASPEPIFSEFSNSNKHVLITDHGFSPENDQSSLYGKFCVQFMIFKKKGSEDILETWQKQCLDWCYARTENGKFGDQKYLDEWPVKYSLSTHILNKKEYMLAPWNVNRFPYSDAILYHFHGLKITSTNKVYISSYKIPNLVIKNIYLPYLLDLRNAQQSMSKLGMNLILQNSQVSLFTKYITPFIEIYKFFITFFEKKYIRW